jgi:hypothetical protein
MLKPTVPYRDGWSPIRNKIPKKISQYIITGNNGMYWSRAAGQWVAVDSRFITRYRSRTIADRVAKILPGIVVEC